MIEPSPFDCRHCGSPLERLRSEASPVEYLRCPRCDRQFAVLGEDELRRLARPRAGATPGRSDEALSALRERLDRWLAHAEGTDPFAALGLPKSAGPREARERFHELALRHHPDRGGDALAMQRIIEAYDLLRDRFAREARAARAKERAAPTPVKPRSVALSRRQPASWARARGTQP